MAGTDFVTESQVDSLTTTIATAVKANTTAHDNHLADATDAHDASAISVLDGGALYTATDVEAALAEVMGVANSKTDDTALTTHINDTTDAHDASAISVLDTGTLYAATDVEAALAEVMTDTNTAQTTADDHISDATGAHAASAISVLDTGTLYDATDVEAALAEVMTDTNTAQTTADNHISDSSAAHAASAISIVDSGAYYTATDVEAALAEVRIVADAAAGGGVSIDDGAINLTQTWSSSKIDGEITSAVSGLVDSAPATLDTLNELAAALGDDASFSTTVSTALGNRLRFDAAQSLDGTQKNQAWSNLQIAASSVDFAANFTAGLA